MHRMVPIGTQNEDTIGRMAFVRVGRVVGFVSIASFASLVACGGGGMGNGIEGPSIAGGATHVKLVGYEESPLGDVPATIAAGQLVVVRFEGKTIARVGCTPAATYKWISTTTHTETLESESADDFRAKLPPIAGISADALTQFQQGNSIRIKTVSAGMWRIDGVPSVPSDCKGATHYVSSVSTGAYEMSTRQHATWTVAKTSASKGGNVEACTAASDATSPPDGCAVAVSVALSPLP